MKDLMNKDQAKHVRRGEQLGLQDDFALSDEASRVHRRALVRPRGQKLASMSAQLWLGADRNRVAREIGQSEQSLARQQRFFPTESEA